MIVFDASIAVDVLLRTTAAVAAEARLFSPRETLHAPHLLDIEVVNALRKRMLGGWITAERGHQAMADFTALNLRRYPHQILLPRIWELRHNISAYDATYVALAELLEAPLVTRDARLAASNGHRATIELL